MGKMLLIDTSRCISCRACQVACKMWHKLLPEDNNKPRTHLTGTTFTLVKEFEAKVDGRLRRLFFKDQCRHCIRPRCKNACPLGAITQQGSGAVVITARCNPNLCITSSGNLPCKLACPYNIPRLNKKKNKVRKCDLCYDRIGDGSGRKTACADACPTGAIIFGDANEVWEKAYKRLAKVKARYPNANIGGSSSQSSVKWLLTASPNLYGLYK
jgi:formate dehydrogenase iron-sulfur subunit